MDVERKDARKVLEQPHRRYASRDLAWSPDGRELAAAAERELLAFELPALKRRVLADLEPLHWTRCVDLKWSPTGTHLAFVLWPMPGEKATDPDSARLFTVSAQDGAITELAANEKGYRNFLHWSPDGKWILYDSESYIRVRPAGEIWEADVDALLRQAQVKK
jgi:sugar lactone lactonase YvrE